MGCVNSKKVSTNSECSDIVSPSIIRANVLSGKSDSNSRDRDIRIEVEGAFEKINEEKPEKEKDEELMVEENGESRDSNELKKGESLGGRSSVSLKAGRLKQAEHGAVGWPAWLTVCAGEVVEGWLPLKPDRFERLEKIGQGTYSSVCRARDIETGKMVALKKIRFDNFRPESVRFMAREITILRRLDHPNVMKLEGIITSQLSCNIYLVFEYMEHDLAGLLSNPDIKFTDAQIKCYMRQLLCGIEHCHSKGVMHRDVKPSNILVNNEGILKIADFGLANFIIPKNSEPLTSRVVTLWYRPPELLLGSTNYGGSVDLWSVGCVFAELFIGRPLLKGRTEVEHLHKIFKLCGTPPDEYWRWSKLPLATMFKPQHHYECTLQEKCKEFPITALNLIETFLSIEPYKRGTALSALSSEYFTSMPSACDPSSLPEYPPSKEIDAKNREDLRRKKAGSKMHAPAGALRNPRRVRKPLQESTTFCKEVPRQEAEVHVHKSSSGTTYSNGKGGREPVDLLKSSSDTVWEVSQVSQATGVSQVDSTRSLPVLSASSGFAWAKSRPQDSAALRLHRTTPVLSHTTSVIHSSNNLHSNRQDNNEICKRRHPRGRDDDKPRRAIQPQHSHFNRQDSSHLDYNHQKSRVRFSKPLIKHGRNAGSKDGHTLEDIHRSRLYRDV